MWLRWYNQDGDWIPTFASAYGSFRGVFSHQEALTIVQHLLGESLIYQQQLDGNHNTPEDEVSFLELSRYMRNQLLRDSDVMSMNWGLELRVPFVDQVVCNVNVRKYRVTVCKCMLTLQSWVALFANGK